MRHLPDVKFKELRTIAEICSEGDFSTSRMVLHKPLGNVYLLKAFSKQALEAAGGRGGALLKKVARELVPIVHYQYTVHSLWPALLVAAAGDDELQSPRPLST